MGPDKAKEMGEGTGGVFFYDGECWGYLIDMDVCIENGEDKFGSEADSVGRGIEFVHEALVPGIYGILEDLFQ